MTGRPSTSRAGRWTMSNGRPSTGPRATPWMIAAIKAAALVEFNAPDYVSYLKRVFKDAGPRPGRHRAMGLRGEASTAARSAAGPKWPIRLSSSKDLRPLPRRLQARAFQRPTTVSIRGSRRGEMIARCVVESGTSSYYTAIRDATDEPVLKEIAGRIAADEYQALQALLSKLLRRRMSRTCRSGEG